MIGPGIPPDAVDWAPLMRQALELAAVGRDLGEVPVAALLLSAQGDILARAHNSPLTLHDPTAHAEMLCLRQAAAALGNYRLEGTVLLTTLEPCLMCVGALIHARIAGLVFGARDPKSGAVLSRLNATTLDFVNHRFWIQEGVLAEECGAVLSSFFRERRGGGRRPGPAAAE